MKYIFLVLILIIHAIVGQSQNHFVLSGSSDFVDEGKAVLTCDDPKLRPFDTVQLHNHQFEFKDDLSYPLQLRLSVIKPSGKIYISEPFFVENKKQTIVMDSTTKINASFDFGFGAYLQGSIINDEYINDYLPLFTSLNKAVSTYLMDMGNCDTLNDSKERKACETRLLSVREINRETRDSIFFKYATNHPGSNIVPWLLLEFLKKYGYKERYQIVFNTIDPYLSRDLKKYLIATAGTQYKKVKGNVFPMENFVSADYSHEVFRSNKYVLVDFWFSACVPCISQFNLLKSVYGKYKKSGFEVIAISVDNKKEILKYKKVIAEKKYLWKQVLDTSGIKTALLEINSFPRSFLLDENRRIIAEDLKPAEIEEYLQKKWY